MLNGAWNKIFISIHALVKRATPICRSLMFIPTISIHALVKRATLFHDVLFSNKLISIHALVKRATPVGFADDTPKLISIHALVKRATETFPIFEEAHRISIHALVKRATCFNRHMTRQCNNFNPRPREEGDNVILAVFFSDDNFNPRPREEGDSVEEMSVCRYCISIHALVKRATRAVKLGVCLALSFQSTPS